MSLFEIVQYEVQVFEAGRWHVRARYPRADRDHAFTEARRIDLNEGHAARVVRDVYDPESGRNQEFTIFVSDRAKESARATNAPTSRAAHSPRPAQKTARAPRTERRAPLAFRATMALGVGLVTAILVTAIASWALAPQHETFASVLARTPAPGTAMTLFVAVMLFSVVSMLRGPLGISRLARTLGAYLAPEPAVAGGAAPVSARARRPLAMPVPSSAAETPAEQDRVLALSQIMLARFFIEAAPANTAKALNDTLGLRGLALYLAGASSQLASHLEMPSPHDLLVQITPAALQTAVREALADARGLDATDTALMSAGRTGMQKYLGTAEERPSMSTALVAWHKAVKAGMQDLPLLLQDAPARAS